MSKFAKFIDLQKLYVNIRMMVFWACTIHMPPFDGAIILGRD